jgi:hypothetical protein
MHEWPLSHVVIFIVKQEASLNLVSRLLRIGIGAQDTLHLLWFAKYSETMKFLLESLITS